MPRDAAIQSLIATLHQTLPLFDQPDAALERSYAPGKWNLRQILVHLSDAETVLLDRLRRIASEEHPPLIAFDENLWTKNLFYMSRDLVLARQQFEIARRNVLELARKLPDSTDQRTGLHSEAGALAFATVLEKIHKHNAHHLEQAKAILEGRTWTPR
jgi:hypothetical protein